MEYKGIPGFETKFEIGEDGIVRNIKTKREKDRALCDRLLAKWHLVKEIGHVVETPADVVAA